jgi:Caspase domain
MKMLLRAFAVFLTGCACVPAGAQGPRCGAGRDLIVQALERVTPQSDRDAFEDALQLLKHAVSECNELGDAWYYRGLVEQRLGHDALAKYAMEKARFNGSEALDQGLNPFVLATPAGRGFADLEKPGKAAVTPTPVPPSRPASPGRSLGPIQQKWALVIGIGRFSDPAVPRLNFTTADASGFAAELTDPAIGRFAPDHVHVLTDEQATTKNIKENLNWIARQAQQDDLVVIYVATHGTPRTSDSAGGANYLVTYDTEIKTAGTFSEDSIYATAYPMVELANAVSTRMKALRTAVILDTCYSGGSFKNESSQSAAGLVNTAPSTQMLARMTQGTGRIVMAASQVDEESLESAELKHGYFTYFLLQAIKDGKGAALLSKVFSTAAQQVSQRASAQGLAQHPVMSRSSESADFALGAR